LYSRHLPRVKLVRAVPRRWKPRRFSCANCVDDTRQSPASIPILALAKSRILRLFHAPQRVL